VDEVILIGTMVETHRPMMMMMMLLLNVDWTIRLSHHYQEV
jgi:steroid 5-alpha reductase family enzyme